jgi:hypothetical protein
MVIAFTICVLPNLCGTMLIEGQYKLKPMQVSSILNSNLTLQAPLLRALPLLHPLLTFPPLPLLHPPLSPLLLPLLHPLLTFPPLHLLHHLNLSPLLHAHQSPLSRRCKEQKWKSIFHRLLLEASSLFDSQYLSLLYG